MSVTDPFFGVQTKKNFLTPNATATSTAAPATRTTPPPPAPPYKPPAPGEVSPNEGAAQGAAGAAAAADAAGTYAATATNPALNTDLSTVTNKSNQPIGTGGVGDTLSTQVGGDAWKTISPDSTNGTPPVAPTPSLLAEPGYYEQWIKANQGKLDTPTRVEDLYTSGLGTTANNPLNGIGPVATGGYTIGPSASANNSLNALGNLSGPTGGPSAGNSAGVLGSLSGGPGGGPSVGSSAGVLSSLSTGPNGGPAAGNSAGVLGGLATGPSLASQVYEQNKGQLSGPGALENKFATMGDAFDAPSTYENWYAEHGNEPNSKGYTENLYESGLGQLDPYYDLSEKRALEAAQRASAARGGFNSGLAAQQESDITSSIRGQQAKQWVDLAPVADAAALARRGQGSDFARSASDVYANRINSGFDIANKTQEANRSRIDTLSGVAGRGDAADTARENTRVTAAGNADDASIGAFGAEWQARNAAGANRVTAAGNVDDASIGAFDAEWRARNAAEGNKVSAAGNADTAAVNAYGAEWSARNNANQNVVTAAGNADSNALRQYEAEQQALYNQGRLSLDQFNANIDLARSQSQENRADTNSIYDRAASADASSMGRLITQGNLNKDLQTTGQNRITSGLDAIGTQGQREADLATKIYGDMSSINTLDDTAVQALADKYGIKLQELKDAFNMGGDIFGNIIKLLK